MAAAGIAEAVLGNEILDEMDWMNGIALRRLREMLSNQAEDVDTGELAFTEMACRLLDIGTCACTDYPMRLDSGARLPAGHPGARKHRELAANNLRIPPASGGAKKLQWWHPLVSGDPMTVHTAGISVRHRVIHRSQRIDPEDHIVTWPK